MNKKYVIFPLIALIVFVAYYWNFVNQYAAEQEQKRLAAIQAIEKKRAEDEAKRIGAHKLALERQAANKALREKKKAEELERKEKMDEIVKNREQAMKERDRLENQFTRTKNNLEIEKTTVERLKVMRSGLNADQSSLQQYIEKAKQNKQVLETLITQIETKEKEVAQQATTKKK